MAQNRPEHPDLTEVMAWALDIAASAPARQGQYVSMAQIPWPMIHGLRTALDRIGADWRATKAARAGLP
jgi:hypothetical protein